jgi:DNA replication protein DnaC
MMQLTRQPAASILGAAARCECEGTGWRLIEGAGVRECQCRLDAKLERKLASIPTEYERLRLEEIRPNLHRHPKQAFFWRTIQAHPDRSYLICGRPGAGKSAAMWALYARAVEQRRPVAAISLAELVDEYKRAEISRIDEGVEPRIAPADLKTKRERWFVGIDDFHIGRPTRFTGEMVYRLLDAVYSYRHQLVITSQLDKRKLEERWAEAGEGYGGAILRRILEIADFSYLTLF